MSCDFIALVSFEDAEWQLNDDVIEPDRIAKLIERASGIILSNVDPEYPALWAIEETSPTEYEIPQAVQQATLMLISEMNEMRETNAGILSDVMIRMLQPWRLPSMSSSPEEEEE